MLMLGHTGQPLAPHDLWGAWNLDPLLLGLLLGAVAIHRRGRADNSRTSDLWRGRAFVAGTAVLAVALLSPLEALSAALASAHMVQHVLLILVAAPLLAFSAPSSALMRGAPLAVRRTPRRVRRALGIPGWLRQTFSHPVTVLVLYVCTLWFWHSAVAYEATLRSQGVHVVEHASFLGVALLFWRVVLGGRRGRRVQGGLAFLLVFGAGMASVLLAVLMTFASDPWYGGYAATTAPFGLEHLADQQLAGVLMWVPSGLIYVAVALAVFSSWIREPSAVPPERGRSSDELLLQQAGDG